MLNSISDVHLNSIKLWYLVQHSLSTYRKLAQFFGSIENAMTAANLQRWSELNIHHNHIQRAQDFLTTPSQSAFEQCLKKIQINTDFILLESEPHYPQQLLPYSDRPPILFGKGAFQNLSQPQIAIVGSRKPSPHGKQVAYDFAYYLSEKGFFITSGLAQGIDTAAHLGGLKHHRTIAVIGTGLDQIYPAQNHNLQDQILLNSGTILSEFLPETKPLQHHFPRRNRIVSGLSLGVLVAEAALDSGSLITAKVAAEQGKIIFAIPGHIYSAFHQGCHQLIREGAILVDHPEQIIEDLALPTQWHYQQQTESAETKAEKFDIPPHLFPIYQQLDWVGQNLDVLITKLQMDTAELTSNLMELELFGLCIQQSGLYLRCRNSY
ncbi:DNA-processing protein DprA [Acinetobacter sp. ANC 4648]|uniref:DNA-processing protein DprA n=1 Tax=Acinetobacter sp. ANC 4648 TaxID=1977875 RepID=UPI000A33E7A6|nr:DNA-processing protein DprA [Acinetobacter sp. ANC 4648]OTG85116.1 DNA protecting protein DprA [Acinetobacter sp. ANC 4648]